MIIITGAAGFIGSCLLSYLNQQGETNIVIVDDFTRQDKLPNIANKQVVQRVNRLHFFSWAATQTTNIKAIYHLGARTDTAEQNVDVFNLLNLHYSQQIWKWCTKYQIPLVYASSAATYGLGEHGYKDNHDIVGQLSPLNAYGDSKNDFDNWLLQQTEQPPYWYGLKFFNVYGPNEFHKGRMASVIFHAFNQLQNTGGVKLFRSHNVNYKHGHQQRDFVYVKDVVKVMHFLMQQQPQSGLYNVGTGTARTFLDLATATFAPLQIPPNISFIDTPIDIRGKYQYFTQANMQKLQLAGYTDAFTSLEDGVSDYVQQHLVGKRYY